MTIAENESLRAQIAAQLMNHGMRPVPDKLIRDIIAAVERAQGDAFECKAYDAHCPSMTVRFQVPEGFPLAGGIFRVQRVRTATPEDTARFAHLPDAPEACDNRATGLTEASNLLRRLAAEEEETANRTVPAKINRERRARAGGFRRVAGMLERRALRMGGEG